MGVTLNGSAGGRNGWCGLEECTGAGRPQAVHQARAVLEVIDEATTGGLTDQARDGRPDDVRALTLAGSTGELR